MCTNSGRRVELGYVVESPSWSLLPKFFPSKVGGQPAWLNLNNVPDSVECKTCNSQCVFLCQVYAPLYDKKYCFHRSVFVFVCMNPRCCVNNSNQNFIVLRCQLPRENTFYSFDPPVRNESWQADFSVDKFCKLCVECGMKADYHCEACKTVKHCRKHHRHENNNRGESTAVLPEYEIVWEPERGVKNKNRKEELREELNKVKCFEALVKKGEAGSLQDDTSVDALEECANFFTDKLFKKFRERVEFNPEQVLRYCVAGEPLWISSQNMPRSKDIPRCQFCGSQRRFEFQVMPQLLNHLSLDTTPDSVDWGTLVVYTCSESCDSDTPTYKEEYLYKQDV